MIIEYYREHDGDFYEVQYPGFGGRSEENQTRSGIAVSTDRNFFSEIGLLS